MVPAGQSRSKGARRGAPPVFDPIARELPRLCTGWRPEYAYIVLDLPPPDPGWLYRRL